MNKVIDRVSPSTAEWAADEFINYFGNFTSIEDYLRFVKKEVISQTSSLFPLHDEFFNEDIHPEDMEFDIRFVGDRFKDSIQQDHYVNLLAAVSSHNNESNIPGRELRWMIYEKNSEKVLGFIRFGSPTINSKPRNLWLGQPANLSLMNRHTAMGFVIVPSQPFGYNCLGGKLLAMLCCTHEVRDILNKKYDADICHFETTSLYGTTKSSSQYDGLKPILRYKGLTQSNFTPLLHDHIFKDLNKWFIERNNGDLLVKADASSRKLKTQTKMIAIIKKNLSSQKAVDFQTAIANATAMTEKKRTYFSNYGFQNVREVLLGEDKQLVENPQNFEKFYMDSVIKKWKKMATKRYNKLKECGSLRTELEVWTKDMDIDIIR